MGIVTLATWKKYAKKMDDDATGEAIYQTYLDSAEAVVLDYLGYSPASATYTSEAYIGNGLASMQLKARPVTALTTLTVDGASKTTSNYLIENERITQKYGEVFPKNSAVVVTYTAGYATVPAAISLTIMRIASLLSMEAGENIGVSSTTFDGGNTRSFINYTNFSKYLAAVSAYRLVRIS